MIAIPTLFYCIYSFGFDGISGFIARCFTGKVDRNDTRQMRSISRLTLTLGYIAALSGCIHIAANGATNWQAGLAVVLTAVLYGLVPQLVFFPFLHGKVKPAREATTSPIVIIGTMCFASPDNNLSFKRGGSLRGPLFLSSVADAVFC
ncbi:MAG: hypothetical protein R3B54_04120 [Bdellovibrionota bacterium]